MNTTTSQHKDCACVLCERLRNAVETKDAWDQKHQRCVAQARAGMLVLVERKPRRIVGELVEILPPQSTEFTEKPFNHPSGQWYWKVCPCGAQHLRPRE